MTTGNNGASLLSRYGQLRRFEERLHGFTPNAFVPDYANGQTSIEKVDEKISNLLKENKIVLSEKETLNFTADENGKITVGKGIADESKRAAIEKAMNEEKTLWRDVVTAYGFRSAADSLQEKQSGPSAGAAADAVRKQSAETILQREYGLSLDDFELGRSPKGYSLILANGDESLIEQMFDEEYDLYKAIINAQTSSSESSFSIAFSYKNGVTVQEGKTDREALDKIPDQMNSSSDIYHVGAKIKDFAVSVNSSGVILVSRVFSVSGIGTAQFAGDSLGRANGKTFTVAAAHLENLPPMQLTMNGSGKVSFSVQI
jgi:hypothetical protein